jgi:glycosyltransferase involved in cell wall biosynthesis
MIEWNESHVMIRDMIRRFIEAEIVPHLEELEHGDRPPYPILKKMMQTFGLDEAARMRFTKQIEAEKAGRKREKRGDADGHDPAMQFIPIIELCRYCPGMVTALGVSVGLAAQSILTKGTIRQKERWALDLLTILRMRPCDVFICMSGVYLQAPRFARWRYGARIILHRGSRHIVSQSEILSHLPGAQQVTPFMMWRELKGYAIADRIAVPSTQVVESFLPWPENACKLFLSPYGVDLDQFPLSTGILPSEPTLLFVGPWSYRKGVDVLAEAIEAMEGVRLIHVGALLDAPFPNHPLQPGRSRSASSLRAYQRRSGA